MHRSYCTKAVLFDFDGTLTQPGAIDFTLIRQLIGCPPDKAILEFIQNLSNLSERQRAVDTLDSCEIEAAASTVPNSGAEFVIADLKAIGLKVGVISRNSRVAIERALENFKRTDIEDFDIVISRDTPLPPKPSPDGIIHTAEFLGVPVTEILVVGDFVFDIEAGHSAGALCAFITNGEKADAPEKSDFIIHSLAELLPIVQMGLPLPSGKLPRELLEKFLNDFEYEDPSVISWPGVGEDTAAVSVAGEEVLVITSDPITFATDSLGEYAVLVNANDIVTSGAIPRWLFTTLLFPVATTASQIRAVMAELALVSKRCDITLCGGHTEITDGVSRAIIVGTLVGCVARNRFLDKKQMRPGDHILLTKGVAIEGTALIAREFAAQLADSGIDHRTIAHAQSFLSRISVVEEAAIAAGTDGVKALHDVTEGGVATAIEEFSEAGACAIEVQVGDIPILPETEAVCAPFKLNPLGLIGSGSLLICCHPDSSEQLQKKLEAAGIEIALIGTVIDGTPGVVAKDGKAIIDWPRFVVDEITRLF